MIDLTALRRELHTKWERLVFARRASDALLDKARRATKAKNRKKWRRHAKQVYVTTARTKGAS